MGIYMRAVLPEWLDPPFEDLAAFVAEHSPFRARGDWRDFELLDERGDVVLPGDLEVGAGAREELDEEAELLDELEGAAAARERVRAHLRDAAAVVGMQILPSVYDEAVAAANAVIDYLEQRPGVLTQVDTVGWYDGDELILREPG